MQRGSNTNCCSVGGGVSGGDFLSIMNAEDMPAGSSNNGEPRINNRVGSGINNFGRTTGQFGFQITRGSLLA